MKAKPRGERGWWVIRAPSHGGGRLGYFDEAGEHYWAMASWQEYALWRLKRLHEREIARLRAMVEEMAEEIAMDINLGRSPEHRPMTPDAVIEEFRERAKGAKA